MIMNFFAFIEQYWIWIVIGIIGLEIIIYLTRKRRKYQLFYNYPQQIYPIDFQKQQLSSLPVVQQGSARLQGIQYSISQTQVQNFYPVFVRRYCRRRRRRGRRFWF